MDEKMKQPSPFGIRSAPAPGSVNSRRAGSSTVRASIAVSLLALAVGAPIAQAGPENKTPNIVVVVVDDLGYADLGCYGSKEVRTPHFDRLAREGVCLTDAYANAAVCSPTRAALITGRYPQRAGFDWVVRYGEKTLGLPAADSSLPRLLRGAGYRTALFGKWHLGYKPEWGPVAHGFDEFFGFLGADLDYYSHRDANGEAGLYDGTRPVERAGYLTDLITERAVRFIRANADRRFFLEVAYNAPHWPFQPPGKPDDARDAKTYGPRTGTRADYVRIVEHLDAGVGRVLDALAAAGLTRDTLVIAFSDNGGERLSDNGPLFHGKYTLWEGGIRVPTLVRWPAILPAGRVSTQPVITTDLTASILAAAGVPRPTNPPPDGEDVLPILAGKRPEHERTFFWRLPGPETRFDQKAVRRGNWKYVLDREADLLFDLKTDVGERTNLAYRHPRIVTELRAALEAWEKGLPAAKVR
jgi:arylsulfatase A-like enzyme